MNFIWEALVILSVGFCLFRIAGKKTVAEMTGLEIITLLSMASVISHGISMQGLGETVATLAAFVGLLLVVQYLCIKFNWISALFVGRATVVVQEGEVLFRNLRKLRMSVEQLETRLREKGITSLADVKTATIELTGQLGYELMPHARPVTMGELERLLNKLNVQPPEEDPPRNPNLFDEVPVKH